MLSYFQSMLVVLLCVAFVLGLTMLLNREMEDRLRRRTNSVNGWQLSILGSIYAVLLGFMLSDAWLAYQKANDDLRSEAAAALTIYRSSALLPADCALPLRSAIRVYVRTIVDVEWPMMEIRHATFGQTHAIARMWGIINRCSADGRCSESARENTIRSLKAPQTCHEARLEDYSGHLPLMMWSVLLFGATIVITASSLLESKSIHGLHVVSLTILISVSLLAMWDLDRLFDGATRVDATAFRVVANDIGQQSGIRGQP
ncbi:MAG TPA: hypothetical protein VGF82_11155 [Terracidiphilus sp.]